VGWDGVVKIERGYILAKDDTCEINRKRKADKKIQKYKFSSLVCVHDINLEREK
jgi:hypothetical protein